jgi:hypothetical protein
MQDAVLRSASNHGNEAAAHRGKRVLFALLQDYYLFDYASELTRRLTENGLVVTILASDGATAQKFKTQMPEAKILLLPGLLRWASNRSGHLLVRVLQWFFAWVWLSWKRRAFDFAIVPWDYRVIWHVISRSLPALTIHNTTDFLDIELKLGRIYLGEEEKNTPRHKFWSRLDKWVDGRLLPRANERLVRYDKKWLIDRLMGYRGANGQQGFSGIAYLTVMGDEIKANYQRLGVGAPPNPTTVVVTGSPNYEMLMRMPERFSTEERIELRKSLGIRSGAYLFSLFLSPSSFSEMQIEEIIEVVTTLACEKSDAQFLLKFHPKTKEGELEKILSRLGALAERFKMLRRFGGDDFNAKLILASDCLVQKQSTVGYLAMMYRVPVLSYNFRPTNYDDDMYRLIGGSYHAESPAELIDNLSKISNADGRQELVEMQAEACRKFCRTGCSPCAEITAVIQNHFNEVPASANGEAVG